MKKHIAIHQPNFFPWMGYFNKIARCDSFIILDTVQFPKTGGSWINRVQILVNKKAAWVTVPIVRSYHGYKKVNEIEINDSLPWREKLLKTLQTNYGRAPYFDEIYPFVQECLAYSPKMLCELNLRTLRSLIGLLGLEEKEIHLQSSLAVDAKSTDNLVALTQIVNGTSYICGGGAGGYQENEKFKEAGIELIFQNFSHPVYPQKGCADFVPGLSILDALFHCGVEETKRLIREPFAHPHPSKSS